MKTLVIIVTIIGLSAVIGSIIVGKSVFEGKVVDKPYEMGLRYDEIEKARASVIFEILNRRIHSGENDIVFTIKERDKQILDQQIEGLIISRPSTSVYDRRYPVNFVSPGRFSAKVNFPMHGYWDIKIVSRWDGKTVNLEKRVYVEQN